MRSYEVDIDPRNARVVVLVGNSDPADDPTYGSLVRPGHVWMKTTANAPPYGVILGIFMRDTDGTWKPAAASATDLAALQALIDELEAQIGGGGQAAAGTYLISGASITWLQNLDFLVGPARYVINGVEVTSTAQTVSATSADATNDRIDVFVLNAAGVASVITGTPAPTPVAPAVDLSLYYPIQPVTVEALATTPTGVATEVVYTENGGTGGGEWTAAASGGTIVVNSTDGPRSGTTCIKGTAAVAGDYVQFSEAAPVDAEDWARILFGFQPTAAWTNKKSLQVGLYLSGVLVAQASVKHGDYGFDTTATGAYGLVSLPLSAFPLVAGATFDRIRLTVVGGGGTVGFRIDDVVLQSGITGPIGGSTLPAGGATGTALFKSGPADFAAIWRAIMMADVSGLAAALALKAPLAAPALTGAATLDGVALATQAYVATVLAGLSWKTHVRAATTVAGTLASSFENGDTIDGVVLATGDRILIKNQAAPAENGIYTVNASGAPTRATDADSGPELVNASVFVSEGTANADTQWTCTTNAPITPGSTSLTFAQFGAGGPPSGAAGGVLGGTYPNPTFDSTAVTTFIQTLLDDANQAAARTTLGLTPGTDVQAYSAILAALVAFTSIADGEVVQRSGSAYVGRAIPLPAPVKTETASYTLVLADAGKWIRLDDASAMNLTVPLNSSVAFPVGTEVHLEQKGAGQVTVVATGGVTVNSPETLKLKKQKAVATLKKVDTDTWVLAGYLEV